MVTWFLRRVKVNYALDVQKDIPLLRSSGQGVPVFVDVTFLVSIGD